MRRLVHGACPKQIEQVLAARAANVAQGNAVSSEWKSFSRLRTYDELRDLLASFLGHRRRCCFCSDSMGADIEHFWPKEKYPAKAFEYVNLLLACSVCNRKKTDTFPVDPYSNPQLINPATDDPWDHVFFTPLTGLISPKMVHDDKGQVIDDMKGAKTLELLGDIINGDPAASARRRNWPHLVERLAKYCDGFYDDIASWADLFGDIDDYGLSEWLIGREGKVHPDVTALINGNLERWRILRELPRTQLRGATEAAKVPGCFPLPKA